MSPALFSASIEMPCVDMIVSLPFLINTHCPCLQIRTLLGLLPELIIPE